MPSINTARSIRDFPYAFVFPYNDDAAPPLYSSINFVNAAENSCLPCCVCGNTLAREKAIAEQASRYRNYVPNQFATNRVVVGAV